MAPPIREAIEHHIESSVNEERVETLEIGVGRIGLLHHLYEAVAELAARHAERNDVGSIQIAVGLTVESPFFLQAVIQGRRGIACSCPISPLAILASSMKRETALKVEMSSWSKPTIMPHRTSRPWAWMRRTRSTSEPAFGRTFCSFLVSISESSFGLSMPTNTLWKLARPISSMSSSSSARSSDAS